MILWRLKGSLPTPSNAGEIWSLLLMFPHCNLILWFFFFWTHCCQNQMYSLWCQWFVQQLVTSKKWVVHHCIIAWFHCGGDHGLNHGQAPCDQTSISQSTAKFQEERNCQSGDGCSGGTHANGGQKNYEQNKLGVDNTAHFANDGVQFFDGVWMVYCGKCNT